MKVFLSLTLATLCLLIFTGCGAEKPLSPYNPMGLSSKVPPEAGSKFDQARVLWKNSDVCSDPQKAIALLDQAIKAFPTYGEAYLRRGMAKSELGLFDEAFDDATLGIRLDPTPEAYAIRGLISLRGKHAQGAAKDLEYSLSLNSSQYKAWNYYGDLELMEGNEKEACRKFSKACSNGDCSRIEAAREQGLCK